jgi:prepilin-type N-terminal cleavage/methylation domain-containing protein
MKNHGFTLIETIVYIALFGLLMSGALISAYNMFESSNRNATTVNMEEEGGFILDKISWIVSGTQSVHLPALSSSGNTLSVVMSDPSIDNPVIVQFDGRNLSLTRGSATTNILNDTNVWLSNVVFTHNYSLGNSINPESIQITFTLNARTPNGQPMSQDFSDITYIRK